MKNKISSYLYLVIGLSITIQLFSIRAECTLGEKVEDVGSLNKPVIMNSTSGAESLADVGYKIHEVELSGTSLKEYVLPNGTVFAVTWRGLKHPDLNSVLGNYNSEYESLKTKRVKVLGRTPLNVKSAKISVRMSGHMRDVHGQAYDPTLLPPNFSLKDLK